MNNFLNEKLGQFTQVVVLEAEVKFFQKLLNYCTEYLDNFVFQNKNAVGDIPKPAIYDEPKQGQPYIIQEVHVHTLKRNWLTVMIILNSLLVIAVVGLIINSYYE